MKKIVVIDGQGGKIGKSVVEKLKGAQSDAEIYAIGTNSIATAIMLKGGADYAATGENAVVVNCTDADVIIGPIGIVIADALIGEVTEKMAAAVGRSGAKKILLPINKCKNYVVGVTVKNTSDIVAEAVALALE